MAKQQDLWTLAELSARVALALSENQVGQWSGRVRQVPDARTIRYYTTLGILGKPTAFRSKRALYGPLHLQQLMAIKRLQARGYSLVEVQKRLHGISKKELASLAQLAHDQQQEAPSEPSRRTFWKDRAAPLRTGPQAAEAKEAKPQASEHSSRVEAIAIQGVTIVLNETQRELYQDDIEAIKAAAEPLLSLLRTRHIVSSSVDPRKGDQ